MEDIRQKIADLEAQMADVLFWENKEKAQEALKELHILKEKLAEVDKFKRGNAVVTIFSGAGGLDAEDFARMLHDMYFKFSEKKRFSVFEIHKNQNDHGGIRNVTFEIVGKGVYGLLRGESGVHRLVRISPFNAKKLRHTSFAMVEIIPKFEQQEMAIPADDIKVEFTRSGGPGGQNVNKRETAVRITHIPTGITVHCDSERSQMQNRERALRILEAKLYTREKALREKKTEGFYVSKTTDAEWGNQIRSYVLHPYKLVKDHRTKVEHTNPDNVLAGDLDLFIEAEKDITA